MTRLDPVYEALTRRARTVSAFGWCGKTLLAAGASALALSVAAAAASWSFAAMPGVAAAVVLAAGICGYFFGRSRPVDVESALFRADSGLGTEARLSTLHAIRDRRELQPFAVRIAAGLPSRPLLPRVALPIPRRQVILAVAGALLAIAAIALGASLPSPRIGPAAGVESPVGSGSARAYVPAEAASDATAQPAAESEGRESVTPAPASTAMSSSAPSSEEEAMAATNLQTRPQATPRLVETLTEIERRMSGGDSELTESDVQALQAYAEASSGPLGTAIRDLLSAPTQEKALAQVRALLANPSTGSTSRVRTDDGNGSPSSQLASEVAGSMPPDASAASAMTLMPAASDTPSTSGGVFPFFDNEMSGASTVELVGATLPSSIGEAGDYSYYITKSVPVEPPVGAPVAAGTPRSLSFERASSIVAGRALPSEVLDAVREYFTQITEGGS